MVKSKWTTLIALTAIAAATIMASSCSESINDGSAVRCTCIYKDARGFNQKVYDTIAKSDFPTAADQIIQCNLFGASVHGTNKSCSL